MYKNRLRLLSWGIALALAVLLLRLVHLQIFPLRSDYAAAAEEALYHRQEHPPLRGEIRSRDGRVLACDRARYDLAVSYERLVDAERPWLGPVSAVTDIPVEELRRRADAVAEKIRRIRAIVVRRHPKRYKETDPKSRRYRRIREEVIPHTILRGVAEDVLARVEVEPNAFPGVTIEVRRERLYPLGRSACHVLGHVGKVQASEVGAQMRDDGVIVPLIEGDPIGRGGLEAQLDSWLRGTWGVRLERDNIPQRRREVVHEDHPEQGMSAYVTLDLVAQLAAEEALEGQVGGAVIMDVQSGEILVLASSPGYDSNQYAESFGELRADLAGRPLLNRAIQDPVRLGSVMKVVVGLAAVEADAKAASERLACAATYRLGRHTFHCTARWGHGQIGLVTALEKSCNIFFYRLGRRLGPESMSGWARSLGLGCKSGIDLPHEWAGRIPDPEWNRRELRRSWYPGETLGLSIGEGNVQVTPLQVTVMMAALANGGKVLRPRLLSRMVTESGETYSPPSVVRDPVIRRVAIVPESLAVVRKGMRDVVFGAGGTARRIEGLRGVGACGKTGSAEFRKGRLYHAWFAGYAPVDNPTVAFAVVIHRSEGHGGEAAGPVAARMLMSYFREAPKAAAALRP